MARGAAVCGLLCILASCVVAPLRAQDRQARFEARVGVPLHRHAVLTLGTDLRAADAASNRRTRGEIGVALPWAPARWLEVEPHYRYILDDGVEHRFAMEATASARPGRAAVENRARVERRVEEDERSTRFRNRVRLAVPAAPRDGAEWFAWNEAFYTWPGRRWTRNVTAAGIGAPLGRGIDVELYYLFQRDYFDAPRDQHGVALELDWDL